MEVRVSTWCSAMNTWSRVMVIVKVKSRVDRMSGRPGTDRRRASAPANLGILGLLAPLVPSWPRTNTPVLFD